MKTLVCTGASLLVAVSLVAAQNAVPMLVNYSGILAGPSRASGSSAVGLMIRRIITFAGLTS